MKAKLKIGLVVSIMGLLMSLLMGEVRERRSELSALIASGALVIDVRSPREFAGIIFKGAINIPHDRIRREIGLHEKDKKRAVIVYCHSGPRAFTAKRSLESAGYTNVFNGGSLRTMLKITSVD